jgi:CheY-like chemotaxis protein
MKIVLVEDDRYYAEALKELLEDHGLQVSVLSSIEETLKALADEADGYIIDMMLPNDPEQSGISDTESRGGFAAGLALARRIRQKFPNARIILVTGSWDYGLAQDRADNWGIPLVRKLEGEVA